MSKVIELRRSQINKENIYIKLIYGRISHFMIDKRLLKRCGAGNGYLTETQSGSFRPPGLRIKRAEG
jgi:hypothetical protein